jgi:rubrerythrin
MGLDLFKEKGTSLDRQQFSLKELAGLPFSKLDDDAFSRVRVILMNGIEAEANRFSHAAARFNNGALRVSLAQVRRAEQHQQTMVNWMLPADQSLLETTIGYEQVAVEVTASLAEHEPDPYAAQVLRFALLEDFDHLYRFSALMDRLEGGDANNILQSYTDILPGRPTALEHRSPVDDVRKSYDRQTAEAVTKLNTMTIVAAENQTHDYYMTIGPTFSDPVARLLYAEIASIEEQHVTHYESLGDPSESWLEKWMLHEATEVYNYWSCLEQEKNPVLRKLWERFLSYELGHLHLAMDSLKKVEKRDPAELLPGTLPKPIEFRSHRDFIRQVLQKEVNLRPKGMQFVAEQEGRESKTYRERLNSNGSPSEIIAEKWRWTPGTELTQRAIALEQGRAS